MIRKIVFVFIIFLFSFHYYVLAQENQTIIDLDESSFNIPDPENGFMELELSNWGFPDDFLPPFDNMIAGFIDSSGYRKLYYSENEDMLLNTYMLVGINQNDVDSNYSDSDFIERKLINTAKMNRDFKEITDTILYFYNHINPFSGISNFGTPTVFGCIYDINNAYGIVNGIYSNNTNNLKREISVISYIKIKNKIINTAVYSNYNGEESINNLKDISESWAKAILEANK